MVDGVPAGLPISTEDFTEDLGRRKSGAKGTTPRLESDTPSIVSGVFNGYADGSPVEISFSNANMKPKDYSFVQETPRPSHADYVAHQKYGGFEDFRGGGHFSGRLTLTLVAAGVIAKKIIAPTTVEARILEAGGSANIEEAVDKALQEQDSIGSIIECTAKNMPIGIGEPFFDSLEGVISHIVLSIPAVKGIEFGVGFAAARMKGSEHNDCFIDTNGKTRTNNAGGINGGISNGNDLVFRVVVKPTASIPKAQNTMNFKTGQMTTLNIDGRHDACIALRAQVVVEAATAVVLADLMMVNKTH
jgi:chorismate synthase